MTETETLVSALLQLLGLPLGMVSLMCIAIAGAAALDRTGT